MSTPYDRVAEQLAAECDVASPEWAATVAIDELRKGAEERVEGLLRKMEQPGQFLASGTNCRAVVDAILGPTSTSQDINSETEKADGS